MFWKIAEWVGCIRTGNTEEQINTREMGSVKRKRESKSNQKEQKEKMLLCVEGNISSGKSTTVNELRRVFGGNGRVKFLLEPLPIWEGIRDKDGNNMITKFYGNIKHYAFAFQMMAYISRLDILREALADPDVDVIVTERSLFTDKNVFAKMLYDDNMLEDVEHTIYLKWFDSFIRDIPEMKIFYIKTLPEVAMQRLLSRNREGENVTLEYLERVHNYHEQWLNDNPFVVAIDGNSDIDSDDRPSKVIESVIKQELYSGVAEV